MALKAGSMMVAMPPVSVPVVRLLQVPLTCLLDGHRGAVGQAVLVAGRHQHRRREAVGRGRHRQRHGRGRPVHGDHVGGAGIAGDAAAGLRGREGSRCPRPASCRCSRTLQLPEPLAVVVPSTPRSAREIVTVALAVEVPLRVMFCELVTSPADDADAAGDAGEDRRCRQRRHLGDPGVVACRRPTGCLAAGSWSGSWWSW